MPGLAVNPAMLATFTIDPPAGRWAMAALQPTNTERRLRPITLSQPSALVSATYAVKRWPPATLTSTSRRPVASTAVATAASTAASSRTSVTATTASGAPARRAAAATSPRSSIERAASTTVAPAAARVRAACLPIPRLAPVTRAVRPSRRSVSSTDMAASPDPPGHPRTPPDSPGHPLGFPGPLRVAADQRPGAGEEPGGQQDLERVTGQERGHAQLEALGQADVEGGHQERQPEGVDDQVAGDHGHDRPRRGPVPAALGHPPDQRRRDQEPDDVAERRRLEHAGAALPLGEPGHPGGEPERQVQHHPGQGAAPAEGGRAEQHGEGLPGDRHRCERELDGDLGGQPGEGGEPEHQDGVADAVARQHVGQHESAGSAEGALRHGHWLLLLSFGSVAGARRANSTSPGRPVAPPAAARRSAAPSRPRASGGAGPAPPRARPLHAGSGGRSPGCSRGSGTPWSPGRAARSAGASRPPPTPGPAARPGTATAAASRRSRVAAEGVVVDGEHGPSVRNRRRLAAMNRFEDAVARELQVRVRARTRSVRALARWAAAALPPGALVADGVALVTERLGDGDPDALAAQVMAETPDRFGRNWESGPAH